jgi:hypothetical protein
VGKNKFRFYNQRKKEFINPYTVKFKKDGSISNQFGSIQISQYSGIKDLTKKEIYEGDIVIDYRKHSSTLKYWHCKFSNGSFNFCNGRDIMKNVDSEYFEIIGNIYQNEEMQEKINFYISF